MAEGELLMQDGEILKQETLDNTVFSGASYAVDILTYLSVLTERFEEKLGEAGGSYIGKEAPENVKIKSDSKNA